MTVFGQYKNCAYCNTYGLIEREFYGNSYYDKCRKGCGAAEEISIEQTIEDLEHMEQDRRYSSITSGFDVIKITGRDTT